MQTTSNKSEILNMFSNIRKLSFQEKMSPLVDENNINTFLDAIIDFKNELNKKTNLIYFINESFEKLTWYNDLDQEDMIIINDIISIAKDLRTSLFRQYSLMVNIRKKGIAKKEIDDFKYSIDELKEVYEDLESVFFYLQEIPEFVDTTKKLSLI